MALALLIICIVFFETQDKSDDKSLKTFAKFCIKRWYGKLLIGASIIELLLMAFAYSLTHPIVFFGIIAVIAMAMLAGIIKFLIWLWD